MKSIIEKEYLVSSIGELFGDYSEVTLDEYFTLIDSEPKRQSKIVAKALTKYLRAKREVCNLKKASI